MPKVLGDSRLASLCVLCAGLFVAKLHPKARIKAKDVEKVPVLSYKHSAATSVQSSLEKVKAKEARTKENAKEEKGSAPHEKALAEKGIQLVQMALQ